MVSSHSRKKEAHQPPLSCMAIVVAVNTSEKKMSKHIKYMIRAQCCQPVCEIVFNFIQFLDLPASSPARLALPPFRFLGELLASTNERKLHDIAFLGIRFKDFLQLYVKGKDAAA